MMKFGVMNHPARELMKEIQWASEHHFDFLDLTAEPPNIRFNKTNAQKIKEALKEKNLDVVGHCAWYIPAHAPFEDLQKASIEILKKSGKFLSACGAKLFNVHLAPPIASYISEEETITSYVKVLSRVCDWAEENQMKLMVENIHGSQQQFRMLNELFKKEPRLGFHLDVGHANLNTDQNRTFDFLKQFGNRLCHVHVSDNHGERDEHLPMGAGTIAWREVFNALKKMSYQGTVTLEVFSEDRGLVCYSRDRLNEFIK